LTSCNKRELDPIIIILDAPTTDVAARTVEDFFPMSVGSYWIYEWVTVDTLGGETPYGANDTVMVIGDTVLNGNTFAILEGTWLSNQSRRWYYRDSADYVLTDYGGKLFTVNQTSDTLGSSHQPFSGWMYKYMATPPASINTPAGCFHSIYDAKTDLYPDDPNYPWGAPRSDHSYFAEGIGNVLQIVYYLSSPSYLHRRLTDYYIAP
jgi:hypothetical protein